jgi:hypothetical protein
MERLKKIGIIPMNKDILYSLYGDLINRGMYRETCGMYRETCALERETSALERENTNYK